MDVYLRWLEHEDIGFDYREFRKGLEWVSNESCKCLERQSCFNGNNECAQGRGSRSCLECAEFLRSEKTDYQRKRYPYVIESYGRVQKDSFGAWLEEEERRARNGVDMCARMMDKLPMTLLHRVKLTGTADCEDFM